MKLKFKINSKSIIKDVFTVASGTVIAQVITFLMTPIITRIYGPTAYGVLGVFMSAVSIIGNTAALSYPQAIVLPKNEKESNSLVKISIVISVFMAIILALVIVLFNDLIINIFNLHSIDKYLMLLPLIILFTGIKLVYQQVNLRNKNFEIIAQVVIIYTFVKNLSKILVGTVFPTATTLILISTFSILFQTILLIAKGNLNNNSQFSLTLNKDDWHTAKKYKDFPLYRAPQTLFNSLSQNLPVMVFSIFFNPTIAGFYSLSKSILNIPINLISKSVGDALYPRLAKNYNANLSIKNTLRKSTLTLVLLGIIPFGIIILFGPYLFELVFGSSWNIAGEFARWMSLWLYFMFISRPAITAIPILGMQKEYLFFEVFTAIGKLAGLLFGIYVHGDPLIAVFYFSIIAGILNFLLIIRVFQQIE